MMRKSARIVAVGVVALASVAVWETVKRHVRKPVIAVATGSISIDYPVEGSIFPPELPPPTWLWRDTSNDASQWDIVITFSDGSQPIRTQSAGGRMLIGESDPRCVSPTNKPPSLTPEQSVTHTYVPDDATWSTIKEHSVNRPATIVITGHREDDTKTVLSRSQVSIQTSRDKVGAPIFYRDVPLMPSENEKGVIKPLAPQAVPLIAWRLRNVAEKESRVMMTGLHTCANCHSFSADGKTLGLDMDGPQNDKGLYAIVNVEPKMAIRKQDLVSWSTFRGKLGSKLRVGFMSQISPDARYVVTTVNDPGVDQSDYQRRKDPVDLIRNYYVANFKDYRFLQVFFPTRGVLAWYSRGSAHLQYLPGADDTEHVHTNAVWSPDGKYLVFAQAKAEDAYPKEKQLAAYSNDPNETQIQYDLYRIPFNEGKGGKAEPILGASQNGMSNSFPKVSPDGRFIVFVQAKNGLLMRPDGQLYIVPAAGGTARRMNCNTRLMNSWHSFSPNGRWLVFSSKSRSPYTQMYLTHIDEAGNDSPSILIENSTAANRAVNIPEFVNIPPDGMQSIDTPAAEYAAHVDLAVESTKNGRFADAVTEWNKALELDPTDPWAHNNLGVALTETGRLDDAIVEYRKAIELSPQFAEAYNNVGEALLRNGYVAAAISEFEKAVKLDPAHAVARSNLGAALARSGRTDAAIVQLKKAVEDKPDAADARRNLGHALAEKKKFEEARVQLEEAVRLSDEKDALALYLLGRVFSDLNKIPEAEAAKQKALKLAMQHNDSNLIRVITATE